MNGNNEKLVYITGGGGKSKNALNISTLASIIVASCGMKVIKHTSYIGAKKCTSGAFLDELKIKVSKSVENIEKYFEKNGLIFIEAESDLVLNNLCPYITLGYDIVRFTGISDSSSGLKYLLKFQDEGYNNAIIVCPLNENFDEASICSPTQIFELNNELVETYTITPEDFKLKTASELDLTGATALYNANLSNQILSGKLKGPKLDVLALNAGIILYISGFAKNITKGIMLAYNAVETGQALKYLKNMQEN